MKILEMYNVFVQVCDSGESWDLQLKISEFIGQ